MKIALTAVGSRGDLQPYVALGLGLQAAGHEVVVVSARNEAAFVRAHGLAFVALNVDVKQLTERADVQEMSRGDNPVKFAISHLRNSAKMKAALVAALAETWNACLDADVIVYHPGLPLGYFQAQALGKISVLASPFPVLPTPDYPAVLFYQGLKLGRRFNGLTHGVFDKLFWALSKSAIRAFWQEKRLPQADFSTSALRQHVRSGQPVLNGYSARLFPHSAGWGPAVHTTGSWALEPPADFAPDPALLEFIGRGEPPIYVGFGSTKGSESFQTTLDLVGAALRLAGQRAVVGLGWSRLNGPAALPPNVFLVESVPHTWLFPRVKAVVHHGGAGTVAAGLTAGRPTVVVPHHADQPAWGQRVYELGVGSRPISRRQLTAPKLAAAISYALRPQVVAQAQALGQHLSQEAGVRRAVEAITAFLKRQPSGAAAATGR